MRIKFSPKQTILFFFALCTLQLVANTNNAIHFKTGAVTLEKNATAFIENPVYQSSELINHHYYRIIQFKQIPTLAQKEALKLNGIELLSYLPKNAFYAAIGVNANLSSLQANGAISVTNIKPIYKLNPTLASEQYPAWAMPSGHTIEITGVYHQNITQEVALNRLQAKGAEIVMTNTTNSILFRVGVNSLEEIYIDPAFYYFEEKEEPSQPEGTVDRTNHRSNVISTAYAGGLKHDGTGITVMLQDNSKLDEHIDYTGRFTDQNATQTGDHGEHCGGIIAGAGNLDPKGRGMAHGAEVLVYNSNNSNFNMVPGLIASHDLTITSKSYSNGTNAGYTTLARQLDQQTRQDSALIHVFSAGNAGSGWSTITGGHKQGKNVVAVGNLSYIDVIANSSSRGPALDGRIKPDICGVGTNVYATIDPNNYDYKTGTSMSCPGVAGVFAQLYDGYKEANGGMNPNSALIKAATLNTGDDLGNIGPDFIYGWGRMNARRAYDLIDNNNYVHAAIAQGDSNTHQITVPAGTAQVRVMVYWHDYEGVASAAPALVNNIDMQVTDPTAAVFNPWVLDPNNENTPATTGIDSINNMEQITIDNPTAGVYSIKIDGTSIPQGPQEYFVVYEFIQDEVVLTYPLGGEGFNPGTVETIRWDSYGNNGFFHLEYSDDNGATWNTIILSVMSTRRYFDWTVPNTITGQALVRVSRGALSSASSANFSIIGTPSNLNIDWVCVDSLQLSWNAVSGATSYEISQLGNKYMDSIAVSTTNSIVLHGMNHTQTDWFSVKSLGNNNARGERAIAIEKQPGTFSCPIDVDAGLADLDPFDNSSILNCISTTIDVSISLKNEGLNALSNIPVHYIANGQPAVNETYTGTIAPGTSFDYTFTTTLTPGTGTNNILVWTDMAGDGNYTNDSIQSQFTYANETPVTLNWAEDFETFSACGTSSNCGFEVCNLDNGFINDPNGVVDDIDWRTDAGGTPSNGTGPSMDYNPGLIGGKYLYLESSGFCFSQQANLISPCINLGSSSSSPWFHFAYNMNGDDMGELHVDIFVDGAWVNDIAPPIVGNQGPDWLIQSVPLGTYGSKIVNLRLRGITGNGFDSDIAVDDIQVNSFASVDELATAFNFSIYPNPSNGLFNYTYLGEEPLNIEVYDITGKVIYTQNIHATSSLNNETIDIRGYADGIYMLMATKGNERVTQKIVKK